MDRPSPGNTAEVLLFIGTRKGLFLARSGLERGSWAVEGPLLAGYEVYHAVLDHRDGRSAYAAARHIVWGVHVHRSEDAGRSWEPTGQTPHHATETESEGVNAVWYLAPGPDDRPAMLYAGIEPAGLFVSPDRGSTWEPIRSLNEHPTRTTWQPAKGGLALHSIQIDPREPRRIYAALSAGGVYRTDDAGATWEPKNRGVRADYLPDTHPETGHCVHRVLLHPARPDRLYQQSHTGTYRSDDRGDSWTEITEGLPSDFGYVIATNPADADTVWVIPEESSHMRTTVGGAITVYRSTSAGAGWEPLTAGLPRQNAYVSILREAMAVDGLDPCGVYFGTSSGHLFGSRDAGDSWELIAGFLPKILSVSAAVVTR